MSSVLQQMVKQFGLDIFSNNSKCLSIFKDLAPGLKKEHRWLGMALEDYGIVSFFIDCEEKDRKQHISKALYVMEADLSETAQKEIITSFVSAFGWDETILQDIFKVENKVELITDAVADEKPLTKRVQSPEVTNVRLPDKESEQKPYLDSNIDTKVQTIDTEKLYQEGEMYYYGHGVEKNYVEAIICYRKAAEQGHCNAQYMLGIMYENGYGVSQDYSKAVEWYQKAAVGNNAGAQCNLGWAYYIGQGVKQNDVEAFKWMYKAANQDNVYALNNLGLMYMEGRGTGINYVNALDLFQKADTKGSMYAPYNIGKMYENGWGVEKSFDIAKRYFEKAAKRGHSGSVNKLKEFRYSGNAAEKIISLLNAFKDKRVYDDAYWEYHKGNIGIFNLVSEKKARNVVKSYAKNTGITVRDIKVLFDATLFGGGDRGMVITDYYLIGSRSKQLLQLSRISHLTMKMRDPGLDVFAIIIDSNNMPQEIEVASLTNIACNREVISKINEIFFDWKQ
ncbi:MAG: sel1 repeat family protein [Acidaminococcaceae bacterium]|nr:sel1 repeat family protein [Acidaminococcaceae bacterium]